MLAYIHMCLYNKPYKILLTSIMGDIAKGLHHVKLPNNKSFLKSIKTTYGYCRKHPW